MIIENFNLLSQEELETFATDFVKKINEANILSGDIEFKIDSVESNEITGDLYIAVSNTDDYLLPVVRSATWTCGDEDELHDIAIALRDSDPLAVLQSLLHHGDGTDFLVVGHVAVDGLCVLVCLRGIEQLCQGFAAGDDFLFGHVAFPGADGVTQCSLIHFVSPPPELVLLPDNPERACFPNLASSSAVISVFCGVSDSRSR